MEAKLSLGRNEVQRVGATLDRELPVVNSGTLETQNVAKQVLLLVQVAAGQCQLQNFHDVETFLQLN